MDEKKRGNPSIHLGRLGVALLVLVPAYAVAVDGVVEINQAKVLANGGHFPFVVNSPGSYRLTSNLDVAVDTTNPLAVEDRSAISIQADGVTIDMNGFTIRGATTCAGLPSACTPKGNGCGICGGERTTVLNGKVHGMGGYGIGLNQNGRIEDVDSSENGKTGIYVYSGLIRGSSARRNGLFGIETYLAIVDSCTAESANGEAAVVVWTSGAVSRASALQTGSGRALVLSGGSLVDSILRSGSGPALIGSDATIDRNNVACQCASAADLTRSIYSRNFFKNDGGDGPVVSGGVNGGGNLCNTAVCP